MSGKAGAWGVMLIATMGALLATGLVLTAAVERTLYRPRASRPARPASVSVRRAPGRTGGSGRPPGPPPRATLRGVGASPWSAGSGPGLLVTGPAIRLIMRLLAVTSGDDAQGRITEADEVVGRIDVVGTIGLGNLGGSSPAC